MRCEVEENSGRVGLESRRGVHKVQAIRRHGGLGIPPKSPGNRVLHAGAEWQMYIADGMMVKKRDVRQQDK